MEGTNGNTEGISRNTEGNNGVIKGRITTSDGKPAAFVMVQLKGTKKGAQSDEDGAFTLRGVLAGNYTLEVSLVGYEALEQTIAVEADKTTLVALKLDVSEKQLQEVVVTGGTNKFAGKQSDYVARLPLKNLENAQVYHVISNSLMKERSITSYAEIFYNAPAVTPPSVTPSRGNEYFMRGFYSGAEFRDGLASDVGEGEDPVNLERVEILKGPSATLFGTANGSFGGIINNVTKLPSEITRGEISYSTGSWGLSRLTMDYNTPLNKDTTVLFRINAARHWENSFQDYGFKHTYALAPTLLYKASDRLTLRVGAEFYHQNATMWQWYYFGPGVTIKNMKDLKAPYNRSAAGDQMLQDWSNTRIFARADYKISNSWTSSTNFVQELYHRPASYYMNGNEYINDSTMTRWIMGAKPQLGTTYDVQQNFTGDFRIGNMRNRLVIGLDVYSLRYNSTFVGVYQDTIVMNDPSSRVNVSQEKIFNAFAQDPSRDPSQSHYISQSYTYSAYASDVINLTGQLLAMASLRVDRFDNKNSVNNGVVQTDGYGQTALSPKFGLVYQAVKDQVSLFGNYMNGFSNNAPQLDGTNMVTYRPSQANQWEGGVKMDVFQHKLSATVSYYNIDVKNALRSIPSSSISVQDGTQRSKGVEVELIANPVAGLNLMAGYGYNDAKYIKANQGQEGLSLGSPKNIANFYASYKLSHGSVKGLGINFGANYVGESTFQAPVIIPSYFICNAAVMYDRSRYSISFKLNNLTDEHYWSWNFIQAQPTRNYVATISYKF